MSAGRPRWPRPTATEPCPSLIRPAPPTAAHFRTNENNNNALFRPIFFSSRFCSSKYVSPVPEFGLQRGSTTYTGLSASCTQIKSDFWEMSSTLSGSYTVSSWPAAQCNGAPLKSQTLSPNVCTPTTAFGGKSAQLNCLHPSSLVRTARRGLVPLSSIMLGEEVETFGENGAIHFSPLYTNTHSDGSALTVYVQLTANNGARLLASPGHYLRIARGGCGAAEPEFVQARAVRSCDGMYAAHGGSLSCVAVANSSVVTLRGLSSPYTLSGTIIVDGFAASVYSDKAQLPEQTHVRTALARWAWRLSAAWPARLPIDRLVFALIFAGSREACIAAAATGALLLLPYLLNGRKEFVS